MSKITEEEKMEILYNEYANKHNKSFKNKKIHKMLKHHQILFNHIEKNNIYVRKHYNVNLEFN